MRSAASRTVVWLSLGAAVLLTVFPLYWTFVMATQDPVKSFGSPRLLYRPDFSAFGRVWSDQGFVSAAVMSLETAAITVAIALVIAIPAAYVITVRRVRGRSALLGWLFVAYLFPDFIVAIPLYAILQNVGLFDRPLGLALAYQAFMAPLSVWLLMSFFRAVPHDLAEAATLDGCGAWAILRRIYLPLAGPGIATTAILVAISVWNEVTVALALTSSNPTVPIVVAAYKGYAALKWDELGAAALLSMAPVIAFAAFGQRYIVRGLTAGIDR